MSRLSASHWLAPSSGARNSTFPPASEATGRPSRKSSRLPVSAAKRGPGVRMPARLSGSAPESETHSPQRRAFGASRAAARSPRATRIARRRTRRRSGRRGFRRAPPAGDRRAADRATAAATRLALEHAQEHHAIAAQQRARHVLDRLPLWLRLAAPGGGAAGQRPAAALSMPKGRRAPRAACRR